MVENGYVSQSDGAEAKKQPLGVTGRSSGPSLFASGYFAEAVRRQLIDQYGEKMLYEGGLSVRTSFDPQLQVFARKALQDGLITYDERRGFHGPIKQIDTTSDWGKALAEIPALSGRAGMATAVVLAVADDSVDIGLQPVKDGAGKVPADRERGVIQAKNMQWAYRSSTGGKTARSPQGVLSAGDVVYVERLGEDSSTSYRLRQPPKVGGGLVAMDPKTGRVLAMVGGFSYSQSEFNRATQAMRQPGSSFKPFVYAAAMDNGYTPASVVSDDPLEIQTGNGQVWAPDNYEGEGGGANTLALRHRALAQPHDGAPRQRPRHECRRRICRAFRHLRQDDAGSRHVARIRRNDGAAHGLGLFGHRQWRQADQADPDRPDPGPLRQDDLQA
jgi:penicillin-binding protein 1A